MNFRVGQKVVRVGSSANGEIDVATAKAWGYSYPEMQEIVTIKTLNVWSHATLLTFHEHDNSHIQKRLDAFYEPGFRADAFRPLVERATDISIFTSMLTPKKTRVRA